MTDLRTADLNDVMHQLLKDGVIDDNEVRILMERFLEDDVIDQDEAEFLFQLNNIVESSPGNHEEYEKFFIEVITAFVLNDAMSPGRLDDYEWDWLKANLGQDLDLSSLERKLLMEIAKTSTSLPEGYYDFIDQFKEVEYEDETVGKGNFFRRAITSAYSKVRWDDDVKKKTAQKNVVKTEGANAGEDFDWGD